MYYRCLSYDSQIKFALNGVTPNNISSTFDYNGANVLDWHMLTGTYDGSTIKIYLDGVLANSAAATGSINVNTDQLWIGGALYGSHFTGKLDETRIYSRALTAADVLALYNLVGAPATVPDAPTIGSPIAGNGKAWINFTAPANNGGAAIIDYTATSTPGNFTGTLTQSGSGMIEVNGLTNGTSYTFTVKARNSVGSSVASASSTSVTPSLTAQDLSSELVMHLKLNETSGTNANDETANNNDGTLAAQASFVTGGSDASYCTNFAAANSLSSLINVANSASLSPTDVITVSLWFKPASAGSSAGTLITKRRYNPAYQLGYNFATEKYISFKMEFPDASVTELRANIVLLGYTVDSWHMATATYNGTTMKLYLDGVLYNSVAVTKTIAVNGDPLFIGSAESSGSPFAGKIDDVRIYHRVLNAEQITALYALRKNYWTGAVDDNWATPGNWKAGYKPAAATDVIEFATVANNGTTASSSITIAADTKIGGLINLSTSNIVIQPGKCLNVTGTITTDNNPNRLYIQSGGAGVANGSLIFQNSAGNPVYAKVDMYSLAQFRWQYIGVPLRTVSTSDIISGGSKVYERTEPLGWVFQTDPTTFTSFKGYAVNQSSARTINYTGVLENSSKVYGSGVLTRSAVTYVGEHLIGNSYTAAINIKETNPHDGTGLDFGDGMDKTVYLYNTGSHADWVAQGGTGSSSGNNPGQFLSIPQNNAGNGTLPFSIPSMQAFMVRVNTTGPTGVLTIPYSSVYKNIAGDAKEQQRAPKAPKPYMLIQLASAHSSVSIPN